MPSDADRKCDEVGFSRKAVTSPSREQRTMPNRERWVAGTLFVASVALIHALDRV